MNPWPNQIRALEQTTAAINAGATRICVTSPTGSGKTRMMTDLIQWAASSRRQVALYTQRKMLFDQTAGVLEKAGILFGRRASGHDTAFLRGVQLCMTQTELSHVYQREARSLHDAQLVLIDEAHVQTGGAMQQIMADHIAAGGACVGYTATPLDIGDLYDELIVAAKPSDMRAVGAIVPAETYGPDEPDLKHIRKYQVGEDLSEKDNVKAIMRPGVFARVIASYKAINPMMRASILFAPGVKESLWFAEQFTQAGIKAAHIDGTDVWADGEFHSSSSEVREQVMRRAKSGDIRVICNRYVLREGIDAPWLCHCIIACVFGALTSYLQSGGRLLRAFSGKDKATIQDHGGNWWRHGSLNADREWSLELTNHRVTAERAERLRESKEPEPITCPQCGKVRLSGRQCLACGHIAHVKSRMVVQIDGTLKPVRGDIFRPRVVRQRDDTTEQWKRMYFRMKRAGMTFRQAEALFFREQHYWPPRDLPLMPREHGDWFRTVDAVPTEALI